MCLLHWEKNILPMYRKERYSSAKTQNNEFVNESGPVEQMLNLRHLHVYVYIMYIPVSCTGITHGWEQ